MSTAASTAPPAAAEPRTAGAASGSVRLGFGRVLRSEWIKLRTLRSTWWCAAIVVVLDVLFGLLVAVVANRVGGDTRSAAGQESVAVTAVTVGTTFAQLVAAVLGVLVISGEYGTGMIRSTFAAVPARLPAVGAKLLVVTVWTFLVGVVAVAATLLAVFGILAGHGIRPHYEDPAVWMPMLGSAVYLALIAALAFAVGTLLRNSAGGIATAIGIAFVLPIVVSIATAVSQASWLRSVNALLPSAAGGQLYAYATPRNPLASDALVLDGWGGLLVLLAWIGVLLLPALILVLTKDT